MEAVLATRRRTISGRSRSIGEASGHERAFLLALAEEGFSIEEVLDPLEHYLDVLEMKLGAILSFVAMRFIRGAARAGPPRLR